MPNRYLCSALDEMRDILKKSNIFTYKYSNRILESLVEEIQTLGNRMEAALREQRDYEDFHRQVVSLKKQVKKLKAEKAELEGKEAGESFLDSLLDD